MMGSVAGALDDATVMSGDGRVDEVAAKPPQARKGPILVGAGEPAITDDIRNQDRASFRVSLIRAPLEVRRLSPGTSRSVPVLDGKDRYMCAFLQWRAPTGNFR